MKKIITFFCVFLLIFSISASSTLAAQTAFPLLRTSSQDGGNPDTTPDPPTEPVDPEPDPAPDPTPEPEPGPTPEPTPEPDPQPTPEPTPDPVPSTPDTGNSGSDSSNDYYYYDDGYDNSYDDSVSYDTGTDNALADTATPAAEPTAPTVNVPLCGEYIDGPYPMILTTNSDTLTVQLTSAAYTVSEDTQTGSTTVVALNKDALTTAISTAASKLTEKQTSNPDLTKTAITVEAIAPDKLITSNTRITVPMAGLKQLPRENSTMIIPAGHSTYTLSSGMLSETNLNSYADDDMLRIDNTSATALNNKEYTISDITYTSLSNPFNIAFSVQKTDQSQEELRSLSAPLQLELQLTDEQQQGLTGTASICTYQHAADSINPVVSNYDASSKTLSFDISGPQTFVLMSRHDVASINPAYIAIAVVVIAVVALLIYLSIRIRKAASHRKKRHHHHKHQTSASTMRQLKTETSISDSDAIDLSQFDLSDRFEEEEDDL